MLHDVLDVEDAESCGMRFAIIYSVTTSVNSYPTNFAPPSEQEWHETEGDSDYEVPDAYAEDAQNEDVYGWKNGRHRKWTANLSEDEFLDFIELCDLTMLDGEGSAIGAIGLGESRACVFEGRDDETVIQEAYVTPYCSEKDVANWLRKHDHPIPICLTDAPTQQYIDRKAVDRRSVWQAVVDCLKDLFG